jgi:hypothetical protein
LYNIRGWIPYHNKGFIAYKSWRLMATEYLKNEQKGYCQLNDEGMRYDDWLDLEDLEKAGFHYTIQSTKTEDLISESF